VTPVYAIKGADGYAGPILYPKASCVGFDPHV
jgi:hypothetical protein